MAAYSKKSRYSDAPLATRTPQPTVNSTAVRSEGVSTKRNRKTDCTLTLTDLFAGAGGFTLGFVQAGFNPKFAVEIDEAAAATYMRNFGEHCYCGDITVISRYDPTDVIIGGPPCQGFSNLGAHIPDDPRNQLWKYFVQAVEKIRPLVFVVENVPPLLKAEEGRRIQDQTRALGYGVVARVVNSADFGAPQIRKRTIIIGSRLGTPPFPAQTHIDPRRRDLTTAFLRDWTTVREAIGDLPEEPTDHSLHFRRNPTPLSQQRYRHIPPGGNRWDLPVKLMPECWRKKTEGGTDLMGRMRWDQPSVTIRTEFFKPEKGRYLHPSAHRPITHREAARLQGFPDDFVFEGSKTQIAKQIGNAVPISLAFAIACAVRDHIRKFGGRNS